MKYFIKNPKTYIFIIIMTPTIILSGFFFKYYRLYSSLVDPPSNQSNSIDRKTNIVVKNPFDDIDIIEDNKSELYHSQDTSMNNKAINLSNTKENISYEYILATYKSKFQNLQKKQENNLFSLLEEAKAEYIKNGSKKTNTISLASKYLNLVNNMEKQSDMEFNTLINNLQTDLTSNSYNTDIIKEISAYYNYYKKSLRGQLFNKATKHL